MYYCLIWLILDLIYVAYKEKYCIVISAIQFLEIKCSGVHIYVLTLLR